MASPSKDATPMWDIMSPEDDKAIIEKFTVESNKVINRWSLGCATFAEKDAAVSFLVQLGAVQITIQSGSQQTTSQKQVSILFGDGEDLKTVQERVKADAGDTKDAIPREGNSVTPAPDSSDQNAEQLSEAPVSLDQDTKKNSEAQINDVSNDYDEDNNYSVWMTEPDDGDDDDNQIPDPAPVVEKRSTTRPREEHPCPDCHAVLHSMWELDLHKLGSCITKTPQKHVYNCDQCSKSFAVKVNTVTHLRKVHNMSPTKAVEKLADLKSTERQNRRKVSESREKRITSNRDLNKLKKKGDNDTRKKSKISKVAWREKEYPRKKQGAKQQKPNGTKRRVGKRSHRYSDENVPRQSKRLLVKLQPLANGWIKILESETVDVSRLTSNSLSNEPHGIEAVSNDKRAEFIHTSIEHQNLNSNTENDTSSPTSEIEPLDIKEERETSASVPIQCNVKEKSCSTMAALESNELEDHGCSPEQVREKHKENSIVMREEEPLTADGERETAATMPMPQLHNSEAEVNEESGRKLTELLSDEHQYQGCSGEQVRGENQDASSTPHIERDPEVNEIHETTYEPNEKKNLSAKTEKETKEANSVGDGDNDNNVTNTKPAKSKKIATTCKFCDLQFKSNYKRKQHVLKIHTEDVQEYKCSTCNRSFINKSMFGAHLKTHRDINDREKYHCKMCKKSFLIKYNYQKHMKSHFGKPEAFKCDTCGKVLTSKRGIDRHINSQHIKEILYTCKVCGKNFYTTCNINEHLETHKEKKTWKCDQCGATFFRESRMKRHQKQVHTTRQCLCEICGSAFKTPGSLIQHHQYAHTDVYNFSCDVCGKKFKRSSQLNAHVKIHSNDPKDKPFKCKICNKCFRMANKLKVHMDWHNNIRSHTCDHCGKSFLTKGNLDKHRYIHMSKKPHECRICSQGFLDLPGLRKHLYVKHQITLKKRITEGFRVDRGSSANHLPAHKLDNGPSSPSDDSSEEGEVGHLEINDDVPQLSEASDSQIVREALLAMMND